MAVPGRVAGWRRQPRRQSSFRLLDGDWLEHRTLLAASPLETAVPLHFGAFNDAQVSHFLSIPDEFDLYSLTLQEGETLDASIDAQDAGSALTSLLRIFNGNGTPLALDNRLGGDPQLTFQASTAGTYYVGVSSAPNDDYNPTVMYSGVPGVTTGLYTLSVTLTMSAPLMPDLTGSSFRTGVDMAAAGDTIPVNFTVQDRGGADPGNFQVQLLLSESNIFPGSSQVLATFTRGELVTDATGRDFSSPAGFTVTLPAGQPSGPADLGLRIVADPNVPDAGLYDKSGVHRGLDWEPLTVVTRAAAGATDLSNVDAGLYTETTGALGLGQVNTWSFAVSSSLGNGELKAEVAATSGTLEPRLTLLGATGQVLIESDSGQIVQSLQPGTYLLTVSQAAGAGGYRLSTAFTQTSLPFAPLVSGAGTDSVAVGDLTGNGIPDIVTANRVDDTVSVFLGTGDGTFEPPTNYAVGARVWLVTLADLTNDGRLDILTVNKGDNTISVLLGNGDGTFQPQIVIPAGSRPSDVTVADVNGDGKPDLIFSNYAADTISVVLGNGDGTFGPPTIYPTDQGPGFAGPAGVAVADLTGDGIPDLIYADYVTGNVAVRLGTGDGTFGPEVTYPTGAGAHEVAVADLTGDGIPDLVVVNSVADDVSVLMGNGNGTFQPAKNYNVGSNPYTLAVAEFNGDGIPDVVTSNRGDNTVSVLLGNGDGTFGPQETFPTGRTPRTVAVGDFTGDGQVDIVTANLGDDTASVLLGRGDGTFSYGAQQAAPAPPLAPFQVVVADLTGDGIPDIITANRPDNSVSVLLGNPDGSFQTKETYATGPGPFSVAVADLTGDGIPDIVTANYEGADVSVLLGNGDGTFQPYYDLPAGSDPYDVKVADLTGDGIPDIIVTNKNDNTVGVFLGEGKGAFEPMQTYPVASGPFEVVVADLTGNGIPDLVVSHFSATVVDVLLGNGDGTFQPTREFPVGSRPYGLAVADLTGDGEPDIVTSDYRDDEVSVLLNQGNGNFGPPQTYPVGKGPNEVQVADLSGDGIPDIVTANYGSDTVSVLLGNGNGTFQPAQSFAAGSGPASVAVADLVGNGNLDLVVGKRNGSTVTVLSGNGNGTFQAPVTLGAGKDRYSAAVADLTGDGSLDVITTSVLNNTVTVQLGNGDGTFGPDETVPVGPAPTSVAVADLNGDGRPDLVTTNSGGNSVSVLLGNGDGTFNVQQTFPVGRSPRDVVVADLTGDGIPDLVVANYNDDTVSVLLGKGDGTFLPQEVFAVGEKPYSLTVADVNGDGKPDIIVANSASDTVSVLLNLGGTNDHVNFASQMTFPTGKQPFSVAVADLTGDGVPDIITANAASNTVSVLMGNGNGTFRPAQTYAVGSRPYSVAVADLTGDGEPDIVANNYGGDSVSVLLNNGDGTFGKQQTFTTDLSPVQTVVGDVNGDGRPDLVTVSNHDSAIGVLLGEGNGTFEPVVAGGVGLTDTPLLADFNGDGIPDTVVLDRSGNILYRQGLPGAVDTFAPPVILNPGRPARAITILQIGSQFAIAAADAHYDPTLSTDQFVFTVSIYTVSEDGNVSVVEYGPPAQDSSTYTVSEDSHFSRYNAFSTTALPTSLAAADLTGNGLDDLIAANALDNSVTIALQISPGRFAAPITVPTGIAPSDIAVADVNGDGLPDIIVSDQSSGDVTVLLNNPAHSFSQSLRFRAGTGFYGLSTSTGNPVVSSFAQTVSLVAGDFTGDGRDDVVVVNQDAHSLTVLTADGAGGFANPSLALTLSTSDGASINNRPGAIVAGDFNRDGNLDLAVLMEDTGQVWIYTGNGNGTFEHTFSIPVGEDATGLSLIAGNGRGLFDLLVGNGFGDVLILEGRGDGTFQIQGSRVSLSVVPDLLGPGQAGVLVGDQQNDRVTVQAPSANGNQYTPVETLGSSSSTSEGLAPGDVQWAVLDRGATFPDAIVVGTGSNSVEVYRTISINDGVPTFAPSPETYFVGTAPASVTVAEINGDGIPDMLVADQGSNDVTVIFGSYNANGDWVGIPGPRLKSGGDGPIAVIVRDLTGDLVPDLAVVNGGSGTVTLLPGVGGGFFDDQQPKVLFNLGSAVVQPPTFIGNTGLGYAVTAGGNLVQFDLDNPSAGASVVYSGRQVVAAQALPSGQVVVALADGIVDILAPQGNGLSVASELLPEGGTPALPSAIDVVEKSNGLFDVLVSSQGSDTIFVFDAGAALSVAVASSGGGASPPSFNAFQPSTVTATQFVVSAANANAAGASQTAASTSTSASTSSGSLSATATSTVGLSLGTFSSLGNGSATGTDDAVLVSVEGNTYLSVPILGFGPENGAEADNGEGRMPWLSTLHPVGDASPLTRFVIGLDEALRDYRGSEGAPLLRNPGPSHDPWSEDLFYRHLPVQPPVLGQEKDDPMERGSPETMRPDPNQGPLQDEGGDYARLVDQRFDEPGILPTSPAARIVAGFKALAGLLAVLLLRPSMVGFVSKETKQPHDLVPAKATRDGES
jgi:FG-GAP-like repeat/Bacterial pre-peptidase C-terminal domain